MKSDEEVIPAVSILQGLVDLWRKFSEIIGKR